MFCVLSSFIFNSNSLNCSLWYIIWFCIVVSILLWKLNFLLLILVLYLSKNNNQWINQNVYQYNNKAVPISGYRNGFDIINNLMYLISLISKLTNLFSVSLNLLSKYCMILFSNFCVSSFASRFWVCMENRNLSKCEFILASALFICWPLIWN